MAGGKFKAPDRRLQESALRERENAGATAAAAGQEHPGRVIVGNDPELVGVRARLDVYAAAVDIEPPRRGRKTSVNTLQRAAEALENAAIPLTIGEQGPAIRIVAKVLGVPEATARDILRRLANVSKSNGLR